MIDVLRGNASEFWDEETLSADDVATADEVCPTLLTQITARIEARLPGRIRRLRVTKSENKVVLAGRCTTYYSKQMAQHTALGVLDDQPLVNNITVNLPK